MEDKLIEWAVATLGPGAGIAVAMWLYARKTETKRPDVVETLFAKIDKLDERLAAVERDIGILKDRWDRRAD